MITFNDFCEKKEKMKINYGLIAVDINEKKMIVYHFAGYEEKPTENEIKALRKELETDEEFGLTKEIHKLKIIPADDECLNYFKKIQSENK